MKLDALINFLDGKLRNAPPRVDPAELNIAEDIVWYLRLLRKREGYNVERPQWNNADSKRDDYDYSRFRQEEEILRKFWNSYADADSARAFYTGWTSHQYSGNSSQKEPPRQGQTKPWHEVLGVRPDSTSQQRLKAYRSLAMQHHPDRGGSHEKMAELNKAKQEAGV